MTEAQREILTALATDWHMKAELVRAYQMMNASQDGEVRLKQAIDMQLAETEERLAFRKLKAAEAEIVG